MKRTIKQFDEHRRFVVRNCSVLRIGLCILTLSLACPAQLRAAAILPPEFEVIEMMMEAQGAEVGLIGRLFGADPENPLDFSSMTDVDNRSFSFELVPGSTYMGLDASLNVSGGLNPVTGFYEWTSTGTVSGSSGLASWTGGTANGDPDPSIDWEWEVKWDPDGDGVFPPITIILDLMASGDFTTIIRNGKVVGVTSKWEYDFTINRKSSAKGKGTDRYTQDGGWSWTMAKAPGEGFEIPEFGFAVVSRGFSPIEGGAGSFNATLVPEPSSFALLGLGALGMLGYSLRRRKRASKAKGGRS